MKNTFKQNSLFIIALISGAVGCTLSLWLSLVGKDYVGLIPSNHPASTLLLILICLTLPLLLFGLRRIKGTPSYSAIFPTDKYSAVGHYFAAAGILAVSVLGIGNWKNSIDTASILLGFVSAGCFVYLGMCRAGKAPMKHNLYMAAVPYFIVYLISQYRAWSNETQLHSYFYLLLCDLFLMFTVYYRACLAAGKDARRPYAFFHCAALFLCAVCAVSKSGLFYIGILLWLAFDWFPLTPQVAATPMKLPKQVRYCIDKLQSKGHCVYVVGGCVRDSLLGLTPNDYDMCTDALPEEICEIFAKHTLVRSGEKHGTIGVVVNHTVYEITTFRTEGEYTDSRHPSWVNFVQSVEEDLSRRDFTINAIAYCPTSGYIDPFNGQADLNNKLIRAVGDPNLRFSEDSLRILRGVRFATTFGFDIEKDTYDAMLAQIPLMDKLARERVFSELCKILPLVTAEDLLRFAPILTKIIPELKASVNFKQFSPHHAYDVYTHTAHTVAATPRVLTLRLAALLHDIGKPAAFTTDENGRGHFYGHAQISAAMAEEVLLRLKAPTALRKQVVFLISNHMGNLQADKCLLRRRVGQCGDEMLRMLLDLMEADFCSKGVEEEKPPFDEIRSILDEIQQEDACLTVKNLAVNGHDLMALGVQPGPHIGECMTFLLNLVQDEIIPNNKDELLSAAKDFFSR